MNQLATACGLEAAYQIDQTAEPCIGEDFHRSNWMFRWFAAWEARQEGVPHGLSWDVMAWAQ